MKNIKSVLLLGLITIITQSCEKGPGWGIEGRGSNTTVTRSVEGFDAIQLSIDADVSYRQDSVYRVEITGQENIVAVVNTKIVGGELRIDYKRNVWRHNNVSLVIYSPAMRKMSISGSGNITSENGLHGNNLELTISGSGNISVPSAKYQTLDARISGSGDISVWGGDVVSSNLKISGSGDIRMLDMVSTNNTSQISGSGNISTYVTENLVVSISGSGDVRYKGKPAVSTQMSGSGRLEHID